MSEPLPHLRCPRCDQYLPGDIADREAIADPEVRCAFSCLPAPPRAPVPRLRRGTRYRVIEGGKRGMTDLLCVHIHETSFGRQWADLQDPATGDVLRLRASDLQPTEEPCQTSHRSASASTSSPKS